MGADASGRLTGPQAQSSARWQVLGAVGERALPVAEIARRMGLTRQSVQRTADLLQGAGLVSYTDNPSHRRAKLVTLTSRGRSVLARIDRQQVGWSNRLAEKLSSKDLETALRVLCEVRRRLETAGAEETDRR